MHPSIWFQSNVDYGRKLVESGLQGASTGCQEFLDNRSLKPFLAESSARALPVAGVGACVGAIAALLARDDRRATRTIGLGLLGAIVGFTTALFWNARPLVISAAKGAQKDLNTTRDERWFEKHPIDYA